MRELILLRPWYRDRVLYILNSVAQWIAYQTSNLGVAGSSPVGVVVDLVVRLLDGVVANACRRYVPPAGPGAALDVDADECVAVPARQLARAARPRAGGGAIDDCGRFGSDRPRAETVRGVQWYWRRYRRSGPRRRDAGFLEPTSGFLELASTGAGAAAARARCGGAAGSLASDG